MRILHTADWHLGKTLKGVDRTPEIAEALEDLLKLVDDFRPDGLVVAGDLFDHPRPPAEAEGVFFDFLVRLGEKGVPLLGVAGNHDPRARFAALEGVFSAFGARIAAELRLRGEGGVVERAGLRAALLPFVSERRLIRGQALMEQGTGERMGRYAEGMRKVMANLAGGFSPGRVNLLVGHMTIEGARLGGGEFAFFVGNSYAVKPEALPVTATYVALGHIHRQQQVAEAPVAWYAGSLLQLDFGEGEEAPRGVLLVEAEPGRPPRVTPVEARWGKPLRTFRMDLASLDRRLAEVESFPGYAKLVLAGRPDPVLRERLLAENPRLLEVAFETVAGEQEEAGEEVKGLDLVEAYALYHRQSYARPPEDGLLAAFRRVFEEVGDASAEP